MFKDSLYNIIETPVSTAAEATFVIELQPEHAVFQAHFPGEPIMPGACIVQVIQEVTSVWRQEALQLVKVNNLKFLSVIRPDVQPRLEVQVQLTREEETQVQVKGALMAEGTDYTKFSLTFERHG